MQFVLTRLEQKHDGFSVSLKDGSTSRTLATVDGNTANHRGPVILLSLDQHSVYGLSHPAVVSRVLADGPQTLLTSEALARRLYDGGMKAALSSIKVRNNVFLTTLETFYKVDNKSKYFTVIPGKTPEQMGCLIAVGGKTILLAHGGFKPQNAVAYEQHLVLDQITTLEVDVGPQKE